MKNKRLILLLSIFAFITVVVILCSTLFTLHTVTFSWKTSKNNLSNTKDNVIAQTLPKGDSIFFLNKGEITESLEVKYPYIKVLKLETKFPNKLVVHCEERVGIYAVELTSTNYAIIDESNKVLEHLTAEQYANWDESVKGSKPIVTTVTSNGGAYGLDEDDFKVGYVADVKRVTNLLSTLAGTLKLYYPQDYLIKGVVRSVNVNISYQSSLTMVVTPEGMTMEVQDCYQNLQKKVALGIGVLNEVKNNQGITTGTIVVEGDRAYLK